MSRNRAGHLPQPMHDPMMGVPMDQAVILEQAQIAECSIKMNLKSGRTHIVISGNFPSQTLISLLEVTKLRLLLQQVNQQDAQNTANNINGTAVEETGPAPTDAPESLAP